MAIQFHDWSNKKNHLATSGFTHWIFSTHFYYVALHWILSYHTVSSVKRVQTVTLFSTILWYPLMSLGMKGQLKSVPFLVLHLINQVQKFIFHYRHGTTVVHRWYLARAQKEVRISRGHTPHFSPCLRDVVLKICHKIDSQNMHL